MIVAATHAATGIEISNAFQRVLNNARIDVDDLPDTEGEADAMISEIMPDLEHIQDQLRMEEAGVTQRSAEDPYWPIRAMNSATFKRRQVAALHRWVRLLRDHETEDRSSGTKRDNLQRMTAKLDAMCVRLRRFAEHMPEGERKAFWVAIHKAQDLSFAAHATLGSRKSSQSERGLT